jgi:aquaporin Z
MGAMIRKYFTLDSLKAGMAELVGTFFLTLAALIVVTPYAPFAVALTLAAFVYAIGTISGCNINPGVTVGLMAGRRLPIVQGILYVVAQVAGALLAREVAVLAMGVHRSYHAAGPWAEGFGFAFLMLTVVAVSDKYVPRAGTGLAIGAALAAGLLTSNGIINPAIAVAMGQALTPGTWAPLVSAVVFTILFKLIEPKGGPQEQGG